MDDDPALRKLNVYGFEVMGAIHELNMIFEKRPFDIIVVTCGDVSGEKMQILKNFCSKNNIALQEFICCENNVELE